MSESHWETPSQIRIMIEFMKLNLKIRTKTFAFWFLIILSMLWCFILSLLRKEPQYSLYPYTAPFFWETYIDKLDDLMLSFQNSLVISTLTSYTQYISDILLPDPTNRTLKFLSSKDEVIQYIKKANTYPLGLSFEDSTNSSLKKLSCHAYYDMDKYLPLDSFAYFLFNKTLLYMGHNISITSEDSSLASPNKPTRFGSSVYSTLIGIAFICLIIRSFLHMIELKEHKLFLLLTISGSYESTIWCAQFLIDIILIFVHSIFVGYIVHTASPTEPAPFIFNMLFTFLNSLSIYMQILFVTSLIPKSNYFKYVFVVFLVSAAMMPSIQETFFDYKNQKSTIESWLFFVPQMQTSFYYQNLFYEVYMNRTIDFNSTNSGFLIDTNKIFVKAVYSIVTYFSLFIIMVVFNPRSAGSPPIGWTNIFKGAYWKKLFSGRKGLRINNTSSIDTPLLHIEKINKVFKGTFTVHALNDVSFDVNQGEIIVLIGPNGSGKSTLLNSMTGSIVASSGELFISGQHMDAGFSEMQSVIGICFQDNVFFPTLSVRDHLEFFGRIRGASETIIYHQINKLATSLDFYNSLDSQASSLSGGQKRKLCISLAFIGSPPVVILDEPTAGIDVSTRQIIWKSISMFKDTTCIVTSHSLEEAESVSSRIFVMKGGQMVFMGTSSDLRRTYNCGYRIAALGKSIDIHGFYEYVKRLEPEVSFDQDRNDSILLPVNDNFVNVIEEISSKLGGFQIESINVTVEGLEHVLLRLISEEENITMKIE